MLNLACLYAAAPSLTLTSLAFSAGGCVVALCPCCMKEAGLPPRHPFVLRLDGADSYLRWRRLFQWSCLGWHDVTIFMFLFLAVFLRA